MLVLARKENESIIIGDAIKITIVGRSGSSIRIGVQAPREIRVMRAELEPHVYELAELSGLSRPVHDPEWGGADSRHTRQRELNELT